MSVDGKKLIKQKTITNHYEMITMVHTNTASNLNAIKWQAAIDVNLLMPIKTKHLSPRYKIKGPIILLSNPIRINENQS